MDRTIRERLAALAHEQWSGWMRHMFGLSAITKDGNLLVPAEFVQRWTRQARTDYKDLPESEKESDRAEADKMIAEFLRWREHE